MSIASLVPTARTGLADASARFARAEAELAASARDPRADAAAATGDLLASKHAISANLSVLRSANELLGATLDILA